MCSTADRPGVSQIQFATNVPPAAPHLSAELMRGEGVLGEDCTNAPDDCRTFKLHGSAVDIHVPITYSYGLVKNGVETPISPQTRAVEIAVLLVSKVVAATKLFVDICDSRGACSRAYADITTRPLPSISDGAFR